MSISERAAHVSIRLELDRQERLIMTPLTSEGRALLEQAAAMTDADWHFCGTIYNHEDASYHKELPMGFYYAIGGVRGNETVGRVTHTHYQGATELYFVVSPEGYNRDAAQTFRDWGYLSGGVKVHPGASPGQWLFTPRASCKVCGNSVSQFREVEWKVCNSCAEICQHHYVEGVGHSGGKVAFLPFCNKCGRGDPEWQPSQNPMEDAIRTVTEGGLSALILEHPDGTSTLITPRK